MTELQLDKEQILKLIKNKIVEVSANESIEIFDESIIYNNCGNISFIDSLKLNFNQTETNDTFIQNLICEHFNVEPNKVITISSSLDDNEFIIRFSPDNEIHIIICPITTIIKLEKLNKRNNINENTVKIGLYRRLGNSAYFFRINNVN